MARNKVHPHASPMLAGEPRDRMTIMSGGFGLCGIPGKLIDAIRDSGARNLTIISKGEGHGRRHGENPEALR
jgi:3-oxoacid CoA-transferase subunit A